MNAAGFLAGYMHKDAASMATGQIEGFVPPTPDPSPNTDPNVKAVQDAEKEVTLDTMTSDRLADTSTENESV